MESKSYPTKVAAAYCGISPGTLQKWRHLGSGPRFIRISGRLVVYNKADLDRWLEERTVDPEVRS